MPTQEKNIGFFPSWLHQSQPKSTELIRTKEILKKSDINTVCEKAKCPNRCECYAKKTATFLALGNQCTRNCSFCDIDFAKTPEKPDNNEPFNIAKAAKELELKHVVITMVTRDDLIDEGASHIALIIKRIRKEIPNISIEVLTSDFSGKKELIDIVLDSKPDIFNHNIETIRSLTPKIRNKAEYDRSLQVLSIAKNNKNSHLIKSGLMVGLGESTDDVKQTIKDLYNIGCDIITIGQYLQASKKKLKVQSFIHPNLFKSYEEYGYSLGVKHMYCSPFVRSSYNANQIKEKLSK
jgi:lipoic acid synthetase